LTLILEHINAHFAASADPAPTADERSAAEEIRFDRHRVKARHVLGRVNSQNNRRNQCWLMPAGLAGRGFAVQ